MNLANAIQQASNNAPEAGFSQVNYGKLTIAGEVSKWNSDTESYDKRPLDNSPQVKGEKVQLTFTVDIKEFNPDLDWDKTYWVNMVNSSKKVLTDWGEIVLPSLIEAFGTTDWATPAMNSPYVLFQTTQARDLKPYMSSIPGLFYDKAHEDLFQKKFSTERSPILI